MRRFGFIVCGLVFGGCVKHYEVVTAPAQEEMGHYILVQYTRAGGMKVWDCREKPDNERWDPTCVRVQMRSAERTN